MGARRASRSWTAPRRRRPDRGAPPVLHRSRRGRRARRRGAARRQGHPERAGRGAGWPDSATSTRVVCALQNGVEQVERVGRYCPESTVVPARGVDLRRDTARGLDAAAHAEYGWFSRTPTAATRLAELFAVTGGRGRPGPGLHQRDLAQAAGQRRGGVHGADGTQLGHVPPRRRGRAGPRATSPNASRSRAPRAPASATT